MRNSYGKIAIAGTITRLRLINESARNHHAEIIDPEIERERVFLFNFLKEIAERPASSGIAGIADAIAEEIIALFRRAKTKHR
ncbi:hypothetical protein BH09VER1_BH09VER1_22500 [soil metagenome]